MSEKKQSIVDWLVNKMIYTKPTYDEIMSMYKFAKAMHREEIKKAWEEGFSFSSPYQSAEIYYNETFGE